MATILNEQQQSYLRNHLNIQLFKNSSDFQSSLQDSFYYSYQMIFLARTDKMNSEIWNILVHLLNHFQKEITFFEYNQRQMIQTIHIDSDTKKAIFEKISNHLTELYFPVQPKQSFLEKLTSLFKK